MNEELTKLIYENENLIYSFIKGYSNYVDKEDLYQVGVIGLINAYDNFKKEKGVKFSTYAYIHIYGEIKRYLRENRTFKINKDTSKLVNSFNKAKNLLEQKLMREPSIKELSEYLELNEEKLASIIGIQQSVASLDSMMYDGEKNLTYYDVVSSNEGVNIIDSTLLKDEISKLSYEDKLLINERYFKDKTQSEVAGLLGLSQVKVSRNEKKILEKLRNSITIH